MTVSPTRSSCADVRPLLFAGLEGELDRHERVMVHAHLAVCESCRSLERAERALTALLDTGEVRPAAARAGSRWGLALAAAAGIAFLLFVLPAATPRGSIVERHLDVASGIVETRVDVGRVNRLDVPRDGVVGIDVGGAALEAGGPAEFVFAMHDGCWELTVAHGEVAVAVETADAVVVVQPSGRTRLSVGHHVVTFGHVHPQDPVEPSKRDPAALANEARRLYFESLYADLGKVDEKAMTRVVELAGKALEHPGIDAASRNTALFYRMGAQGRMNRHADALATANEWLEAFDGEPMTTYVMYFQASYLDATGDADAARHVRERILELEQDTDIARHTRTALGLAQPQPQRQVQPPAEPNPMRAVVPARAAAAPGPYLVVSVALQSGDRDAGFLRAAARAASFHDGVIEAWDGRDFDALSALLERHHPENVLFVLRPEWLDIRLHRQILLRAAAVDDDIFSDFAFGYLTARDGDGVLALWERTQALHEKGLDARRWVESSITSAQQNIEYDHSVPAIARAAGFDGAHYYISYLDPARPQFVERVLADLETASVISLTGNGDPQGIWMFDDHRNIDRSRHWPYHPDKVGDDPEGEMPRITAREFAALELSSPILWSGTCHSGATCNVFVEGDIVSTFGRTERTTVHRLHPDRSLALAWIEAGAAALLVPIAANHGASVSMEVDFALRWGASLGEAIKSTHDDVLLAADGKLALDIPIEGEPHGRDGYVMQGGGANRILIGDPALRPFAKATSPIEQVEAEATDDGFVVMVDRADGYAPTSWDIFGEDRAASWRIRTRVDLESLVADDQAVEFEVDVTAEGDAGALPYAMRRCIVEDYHGRRYLHLQANGEREVVERKKVTARFVARRLPR